MTAHDREVGGIRCMEVLVHLSSYLDGDLEPPVRARVDAHLAGCDWCERFGGRVGGMVAALRLAREGELPAEVAGRLQRRIDEEG